ncbi:AraC family transcriptional regulator [Nocardia huaxiensis]|uniref:AraC family transcriptional regulator n=1 Tax=Nocardia huaxiensis TaxID=2755382 RepID=A0A7D6Z6S3_9NOCA|nr:AraC family transcriptional regulator [Nocardia huaxiensis]QLY28168.1 AraC family transcriptional regulator [Nocardia huaxiensis]UFS98386.1 AraC family transcriptional regulator [Nocardia huaxiensis]
MDVLSEVLATARTGSPASGMFVRHAPWGRAYPRIESAGFHVVLQGSCWLTRPGADPIALGVGDVAFMPRGVAHDLLDQLDSPVTETAGPSDVRFVEGPGAAATLLCGSYQLATDRTHPMLAELPEVLHIPARLGNHPSVRATVDLLADELTDNRPGSDAAVPPLLELLLLYLLRAWIADTASHEMSGWAAAFADPDVSAALRAIHEAPAHPWTVESLGARAGLSRAAFARRFTTLVGEPPLAYLTRWRMIIAARLLRDTDSPLSTIARHTGYSSEYAFAKAFKREYGTAPGQYRKSATDVLLVGA